MIFIMAILKGEELGVRESLTVGAICKWVDFIGVSCSVEGFGGLRDRRRVMLRMIFCCKISESVTKLLYISCSLTFSLHQSYSVGLTYPELKTKLL